MLPVRQLADEADFLLSIPVGVGIGAKRNISGTIRSFSGGLPLCVGKRQKGLGFDTIGIDPIADEGLTRHRLLLSQRDIVIIENLTNLDKIGKVCFSLQPCP